MGESIRGFVNSLRPSSQALWAAERRAHFAACFAIIKGDEDSEWAALRDMAAARDELDRRGVTHL